MAMRSPPVGVFILGDTPPRRLVELSQSVEEKGFSELWFAEDYFKLSGFSSAAIALQATKRINVGIGAVSGRVRHPAVAAMEASTLAGAYPGRFKFAIGHGVPAWVKQMKLNPKSTLDSFREAVTGVKRLFVGETLTEQGQYYGYDDVQLSHPAPDLKVLGAVIGPNSIDLCAEITDGMVISVLSGPKYVQTVKERIASIRDARGLPREYEMVTYVLTCVGNERAEARTKLLPVTAFYLSATGPTLMTEVYGANEKLVELIDRGGAAALEEGMPDDWYDWLGIAGEPGDCVKGIKDLFAAGATSVVLCITPAKELATQLDLIAREVLPAL